MTRERIETLFRTGAITFQEALDLGVQVEHQADDGNGICLPSEPKVTKAGVMDDFLAHLLDPWTDYENGTLVTYDFIDIDEIEDSLARRNVKWRGETVTKKMIEDEIRSLTRDCVTNLIKKVESGEYEIDDEHLSSQISGTCFEVEAWFSEDCKTIEVEVHFTPDSGFASFDYEKYRMCKE